MTIKLKEIKMKNNNLRFIFFVAAAFFCIASFFPFSANAQRRDHLTEAESELVREAQELDRRTEVFVKAVERRFSVLNNAVQLDDKKVKKEAEKWGELPKGTRMQILQDIEKILQEAVDNIDNVAERDAKSELLPKAVRVLSNAAQKFLPQLKAQLDKTNTEIERGAILGAIDFCNQVIEASVNLPKEEKRKKKS